MHRKIRVGLYGGNGHQIGDLLENSPYGEIVAFANVQLQGSSTNAVSYDSLDDLLADPRVELVSLCSPRRIEQAGDAIACLRAGKHVYAEKPAAFSDESLDAILDAARIAGLQFHEMADTVFRQPFYALREIVRAGKIGEIAQVWVQKSYRSHFGHRPQDEDVDGGLVRQCSIHAIRMIEHITGVQVSSVAALETSLGNSKPGKLKTAASLIMALENGGIATVIANYFNPAGFGSHGNDQVRIFGTLGMAEITDDGLHTRLIVEGEDLGPIDTSTEVEPFLVSYLKHLQGVCPMPMSLEEELHPLRIVNRAKLSATEVIPGKTHVS